MFAYLISALLLFSSFNSKNCQPTHSYSLFEKVEGNVKNSGPEAFLGLYNGYFGQSPIEITLETVSENGTASGFSVHKGLKPPFSGTWEKNAELTKVKFILHEPGDNKYDGHFELMIDANSFEGEGTWFPKPNSELSATPVTLKKQLR